MGFKGSKVQILSSRPEFTRFSPKGINESWFPFSFSGACSPFLPRCFLLTAYRNSPLLQQGKPINNFIIVTVLYYMVILIQTSSRRPIASPIRRKGGTGVGQLSSWNRLRVYFKTYVIS